MKKKVKLIIVFLLTVTLLVFVINFYVLSFSKKWYYNYVENLDRFFVWLVLWASVVWNNPSDILKDRLNVIYKAYELWKIEKIIVSWDNSKKYYNEPIAMQKYLVDLWVSIDDIYIDYAWFDTYDSIYRAKEIFWVRKIIIFTQDFHLKRAMYIAKRIWLETLWVETNLQLYVNENYNNRREIFARIKAFLDVEIFKSKPKFLWEKIKIISDKKVDEVKRELLEEFP